MPAGIAALALRTGVLIGLGLDQNTANYQLRWRLANQVPVWNEVLKLGLSPRQVEEWTEALRQSVGPALSANRTMGSLGGLVASRIAREFRIGGPSFSVSCDETSGTQALQVALDWLRKRRARRRGRGGRRSGGRCSVRSGNEPPGSDRHARRGRGGPRAQAAERRGSRRQSYLRGHHRCLCGHLSIDAPTGPRPGDDRGCPPPGILRRGVPADGARVFASAAAEIGAAGAASGLASVVKTALCLYQQIIPSSEGDASSEARSGDDPVSLPATRGPRYWLRNRAEGPRRAGVTFIGSGRNVPSSDS